MVHLVAVPEVGVVGMTVPRPSAMLLNVAEGHCKRAQRLRKQLPNQVKHRRWVQPGFELDFSNEALVHDFFEEAMAAVLLLYAALDSYANEAMPTEFAAPDAAGQLVGRTQIEGYWSLPKRLADVLPRISTKPSIESAEPEVWRRLEALKGLRDAIGHVQRDAAYTGYGQDPADGLWSQLIAADVADLLSAVEATMDCYGQGLG
jgi:hypothetical protein